MENGQDYLFVVRVDGDRMSLGKAAYGESDWVVLVNCLGKLEKRCKIERVFKNGI